MPPKRRPERSAVGVQTDSESTAKSADSVPKALHFIRKRNTGSLREATPDKRDSNSISHFETASSLHRIVEEDRRVSPSVERTPRESVGNINAVRNDKEQSREKETGGTKLSVERTQEAYEATQPVSPSPLSPPKPRKPTVPLDVGPLAAPRAAKPIGVESPTHMNVLERSPNKATVDFSKQEPRHLDSPRVWKEEVTHAPTGGTKVITEFQSRPTGELISNGEKKMFRIVGDPVIDEINARTRARKQKERKRLQREEAKRADQKATEEARQRAASEERAKLLAEETERKRLEVERNREMIRAREEERIRRLNQGLLKADMKVIKGGTKPLLEKFEEARRREQEERTAALEAHIAAAKEASKNRRGSKLKRDIIAHERSVTERERLEAEQRRIREREARERQKAHAEALEATLASASATAEIVHALSINDEGGLSKAMMKIREENLRRHTTNELKVTPRTVSVSPPKPFKLKPFVPPPTSVVTPRQVKPIEEAVANSDIEAATQDSGLVPKAVAPPSLAAKTPYSPKSKRLVEQHAPSGGRQILTDVDKANPKESGQGTVSCGAPLAPLKSQRAAPKSSEPPRQATEKRDSVLPKINTKKAPPSNSSRSGQTLNTSPKEGAVSARNEREMNPHISEAVAGDDDDTYQIGSVTDAVEKVELGALPPGVSGEPDFGEPSGSKLAAQEPDDTMLSGD